MKNVFVLVICVAFHILPSHSVSLLTTLKLLFLWILLSHLVCFHFCCVRERLCHTYEEQAVILIKCDSVICFVWETYKLFHWTELTHSLTHIYAHRHTHKHTHTRARTHSERHKCVRSLGWCLYLWDFTAGCNSILTILLCRCDNIHLKKKKKYLIHV